jgi:hypothetical protein
VTTASSLGLFLITHRWVSISVIVATIRRMSWLWHRICFDLRWGLFFVLRVMIRARG